MTSAAPDHTATGPVGLRATEVTIAERPAWHTSGLLGVVVAFVLFGASIWFFVQADATKDDAWAIPGAVLLLLAIVACASLCIVQPGTTAVVQFFGRYVGTARREGLVWLAPLTTHKRLSIRVRNFETGHLKVNDAAGNPVEIAAIVVWQVADTAKARFAVESYQDFIETQAEAAVRHVAGAYPYDADDAAESLRGSTDRISHELAVEVAERVAAAGLVILEVRISHLAYAPEIAQAMLQRQQAAAVVAARSRIVEGAVGMVEMALDQLRRDDIVDLDEERKAAMVSNLLVVLCGDSRATPVVNTGTLYQ
jgi:regulator of protease activity HflC (stomatin/prohibitin superfamily)